MSYKTSNAEGHVDFINTYDLEPMAQQVIPKAAFGYIASGAEDTFTLRENIRAFNHKLIVPHTLCDVENPSTEIEFAGEKLSSPIIMAPVAAHKLANEQGEVATARGVHEFGSLYTTSIQPVLTLLLTFQRFLKPFKGHPIGSNFTLVRMTVSTATSWIV
ncbi:lactate oxidase [Streptococcus pneumoniae]|nr:lactate oxidase [Streptococcus pneumoniae]